MLEMGPQEDYIETVLTCEGDFHDPQLHSRLEKFRRSLKDLLLTDMHKLILKKVEPWNSVRVTFNIPKEAALRLKQLAQQGNAALRELGVLAVQIQGDQVVSLTIAGRNNERTELILRTTEPRPGQPAGSVFDAGLQSSDEMNSPGPSNVEITRKNIAEYLRQGTSLFDTIINQSPTGPGNGVFKSPNVVATSSEPIPFRPNNVISTSPGNTTTVTSQTPMFMSNFPPGRSPTGYPASPSASYSTSPGPSRSPVHQPGLKYPSPTGIPPQGAALPIPSSVSAAAPPSQAVGSLNHVGLPPPPPYPGNSATVNNIPRPGKAVSVSSPLLVNLLQTEPLVAGFNNLPGSKMLPPQEGGPPPKKRRRSKKPKDASKSPVPSDGEVPIQSVLNPALDAASVLSNDRVESSMDSTLCGHQADPNVSLDPSQRSVPLMLGNPPRSNNVQSVETDNRLNPDSVGSGTHQSDAHMDSLSQPTTPDLLEEKGVLHEQHDPFTPEITAGKIINPYTGQLEPMDKSPLKSAKLPGSGAPGVSNVQHVKPSTKPSVENVHDLFLNRGRKHVQKSATVTSEDMLAQVNMAGHVEASRDVFGVSERTAEAEQAPLLAESPSSAVFPPVSVSVAASAATVSASEPHQIYAEAQQSSQCAPTAAIVSTPLSSIAVPSPVQSQASVPDAVPVGVEVASNSPSSRSPPAEVKTSLPPHPASHPVIEPSGSAQSQASQQSAPRPIELHNSDRKSPYPTDNDLQGAHGARDSVIGVSPCAKASAKVDSVSLLNSPSARTTDSNCLSASPENKMPSEGDENSNHSGIINDITADNTTSAGSYLDSGASKVYNHDSGVGSSSERSDDTPSEAGEAADNEELSKSQKLVDCKSESKQLTVACVMEHEHIGHVKNHVNFVYGQTGSDLHPNNQVTVLQCYKDTKHFADQSHIANTEQLVNSLKTNLKNGPVIGDVPLHKDLDRSSSSPSKTVPDIRHQHLLSKHSYPKGVTSNDGESLNPRSPNLHRVRDQSNDGPPFNVDSVSNSQKLKASPGELMERTSSYQCNTPSPEWLTLPGLTPHHPQSSVCDTEASDSLELSQSFAQSGRLEPHSPNGTGPCLANISDIRCQDTSPKSAVEKFFPSGLNIDALQASAKGLASKGDGLSTEVVSRSNITSKYSKRSSPVNVNMLNHMYASGLPPPRRLTESIQRLVKPLGDPSLPQMRACKSPGASGSKHGANGEKSPRAAHGGRSPGASVPRSSANSGIPTSQAALASSMPSNLPNLQQQQQQQNTLSGGAVSVNYSPSPAGATTVSQTLMCQEGQSGSLKSCSGNPQMLQSDRSFYSSSQQHSIPYGTYSSPSDNRVFESSSLTASKTSAVAGFPMSQQQDVTDSVVMSNLQQPDLADQLVPLSMSHKCNTHSGPLSQATPPYANLSSAPVADVSENCAVNQTITQPDLIDSAANHNSVSTRTETVSPNEAGSCPVEQTVVAEESLQDTVDTSVSDVQHQSQHSTVQSAGNETDSCDAVSESISVQWQQQQQKHPEQDKEQDSQTSGLEPKSMESHTSDVPKLTSVGSPSAASTTENKDSESFGQSLIGHKDNHLGEEEEKGEGESVEVANMECSSDKDIQHDTQDLCSSEAANISDTPNLLAVANIENEVTDIPKENTEEKQPAPSKQMDDGPPILTKDVLKTESSLSESKPLKMVAELLKSPATNCAPSLESMNIEQTTRADEPISELITNFNAQETADDAALKHQNNSSQPPVLEPVFDVVPSRRMTRKRKSNHSESDSNKESDTDSSAKPESTEGTSSKAAGAPPANPDPTPTVPVTKADTNSGARRETRRHAHVEEKLRNSEEVNDKTATEKHQEHKQDKQKEGLEKKVDDSTHKDDDQASKRSNASRRNKSLPAAPPAADKAHPYSFFNISIIRGRTRSQSAPSTENKDGKVEKKEEKEEKKEESPDSQKRSTRSSRQKDHSEQPVAKRRRSRDHR